MMPPRPQALVVGAFTVLALASVVLFVLSHTEPPSTVSPSEVAPLLSSSIDGDIIFLSLGEGDVVAEVARSMPVRIQGLSGRPSLRIDMLCSDEACAAGSRVSADGMLFLFDESAHHGIWMPDMLVPLDILWLDETFAVVDFEENVAPETYPAVFRPSTPARYVLEVPAGFIAKSSIERGDVALVSNIMRE